MSDLSRKMTKSQTAKIVDGEEHNLLNGVVSYTKNEEPIHDMDKHRVKKKSSTKGKEVEFQGENSSHLEERKISNSRSKYDQGRKPIYERSIVL